MSKSTGIALFVYNRPEHTKRVLEGLKKNNIDKLYIFADGPKNEEHIHAVKRVRNLIKSIGWCQTEIINSNTNKGLANSIIRGVNYVLERHERIIVLEDDCVPSIDFVKFMEICFDKYENVDKVMSLSGFSFPISVPKDYCYDIYFSQRISSWGWGTWKDSWRLFSRTSSILDLLHESDEIIERVNSWGRDLIPMLKSQYKGEVDSWAVFWALNVLLNDGLCIYPITSKIQNIGFNTSGTHCKETRAFSVTCSNERIKRLNFPPTIGINEDIKIRFENFLLKTVSTN